MKKTIIDAGALQSAATEKEIRQYRKELVEVEVKNWFVNFEDGENVLVHCNQKNIGASSIKKFAEIVCGKSVIEVYHVPQEELQYYCIDERVWINTPQKAEKLLKTIAA